MKMNDLDIKYGFWDSPLRPRPKATSRIEAYIGQRDLNLLITQLPHNSPAEEKRLIKAWSEKLPNLADVEYIRFYSKVPQSLFEAICKMPNLKGLYIKWSGIKDLSEINRLTNLRYLHIGESSAISDISPLNSLKNLVTLDIGLFSKIADFTVLSTFSNLEALNIQGGFSKTQSIASLKPLNNLLKMRSLTLLNIKIEDQQYEPILSLKALERLEFPIANKALEQEILKNFPGLKYGNIENFKRPFIRIVLDQLLKRTKRSKIS